MAPLHITNGDIAAERIRRAGFTHVLPWRDLLHEGPVPRLERLADLSRLRAEFIGDRGWGAREEIAQSFSERDRQFMAAIDSGREIVLWFEDDLYDQLQLLQILHELEQARATASLVQAPGNLTLYGAEGLRSLYEARQQVTAPLLRAADTAWKSFTSDDPRSWTAIADGLPPTHLLPYLNATFDRLLRELPSPHSGLTLSEHRILDLLELGQATPARLFASYQKQESSPYLGDTTFLYYLQRMSAEPEPVILADLPMQWSSVVRIAQKYDAQKLLRHPRLNRWLGGSVLQKEGKTWTYHEGTRTVELR